MKFHKIKQFTSNGRYEVHIPVADVKTMIDRYIKEYGLRLNPDFQRGHVWNEQQQVAYVEYLLKGGTGSRIFYFNCPNWMSGRLNRNSTFVCVDGLQRVTAIRKFLNDEIQAFDHYYREFEDEIDMLNCVRFNVNNLQTRREVLRWYLEMNLGGVVHTDEEIEKVKKLLKKEQ